MKVQGRGNFEKIKFSASYMGEIMINLPSITESSPRSTIFLTYFPALVKGNTVLPISSCGMSYCISETCM